MKTSPNKKILIYLVVAILLAVVLFFIIWNQNHNSGKCGIENCHGLDITCGPNVAEVCTMIYEAGDRCRQYATCQISDGKCQLVTSQKFNDCKSCVETCYSDFENNVTGFFQCESKCA